MSREIVHSKSLILLRIQTFFLILPTVNSENPSGIGRFHPFFRAEETLEKNPAKCIRWHIIQSPVVELTAWPMVCSSPSSNPNSFRSFSDTSGWTNDISLIIIYVSYHIFGGVSREKWRVIVFFWRVPLQSSSWLWCWWLSYEAGLAPASISPLKYPR